MRKLLLHIGLLTLAFSFRLSAATINVSDYGTHDGRTEADVVLAIAATSDGDTVQMSSGSVTWSSALEITKNITLKGAGSGSTTITDNYNRITLHGSLIKFTVTKDLAFGLAGMTLTQGTGTGISSNGVVAVFGGTSGTTSPTIPGISRLLRITGVTTNYTAAGGVAFFIKNAIGVIDHCTINTASSWLVVYHTTWLNGNSGHGSWADDPNWGSDRFLFAEDCTVTKSGTGFGSSDSYDGARYVVRHSTFNNGWVSSHGTEAGGRGTKQIEIYENTFNNTTTQTTFPQLRSGSVLMHDNVLNGFATAMSFKTYRFTDLKLHWGVVDGTNPYDVNATDDGSGGSLYDSGTATGPDGSKNLIDSAKTWSSLQWATDNFAYVVVNKSRAVSPTYINSVTAPNQLNLQADGFANPLQSPFFINTGDNYEIRKVLKALDQPGQGKGDSKSGLDYLPAAWPNTVSEPCYSWNNWTNSGHTAQLDFNNLTPTLKAGVDYFNQTAKPGYTPYTYPHPLTGASTGKIITLTGDLAFGSVIIGETPPVRTVTVGNAGDATLTVSGVAYTPSVFTGPTDSFAVAPGATFNVDVTCTPVSNTTYSGNATFTSDATGGTGVIAATCTGVVGPNDRPFGVFRVIRNVLSKWSP